MNSFKTVIGSSALLALAACGTPGPSVPFQAGSSVDVARQAVDECAVVAPKGGQERVNTTYVVNMVLFGIIPGAIGTAAAEPSIRDNGEAAAVDRCLQTKGFDRRNLTDPEIAAINAADPRTRRAMLNHFVAGGSLESFTGT